MVENGRRLAEFADCDVASVPVDAVPVTVWVKPAQVEDRGLDHNSGTPARRASEEMLQVDTPSELAVAVYRS